MQSAVVLDSLSTYFGARCPMSDASLDVEPGQVFGLLGPTGAGESTTIRLADPRLPGLLGQAPVCWSMSRPARCPRR
jgi:ABC-type multidrug transport system ATPase subunit